MIFDVWEVIALDAYTVSDVDICPELNKPSADFHMASTGSKNEGSPSTLLVSPMETGVGDRLVVILNALSVYIGYDATNTNTTIQRSPHFSSCDTSYIAIQA